MGLSKNKLFFLTLIIYFIIFGLIASFLIPPFQKPDEVAHFKKVVSLANFDWSCRKEKQPINPNLYRLITSPQIASIPFNYHSKMPFSLYKEPPIKEKSRFLNLKEGCRFKDNIGYLIPVVFYKILSFLPINGVILFGLIRFSIYIFCYSILVFIILRTKNNLIKHFSFFVLSLPMTVNQLSSFSYDVSHLFFGLIFTNLFFNFLEEKKVSQKSLIFLLIAFFLFTFSKPLYDLFFLLFFLIKKEKLLQIKVRKTWLLAFVFLILLVLRLSNYGEVGMGLSNYDPRIQKEILLKNPFRLVSVFSKTYFDSFEFYIKSLIGVLGWLDFHLDFFVYFFFIFIFGCLIALNLKSIKVNFYQALIYFLLIAGSIFIIHLGEFFYWTTPGASSIAGVQGRYLIIFFPYIALFLTYLIKNFIYSFLLIIFLLLFLNIRAVFYRYYDYSVYAKPTSDLLLSKKRYILIKPQAEKTFIVNKKTTGACYGIFLKFKNKKFDAPIRVEIYDKKNKQTVYFTKEQVSNSKEIVGVSFSKTRFQPPVFIKVINKYSPKSLIILDEVALNCIQDYWY